MFKRKKKKTGCETPEYRCPTMPPSEEHLVNCFSGSGYTSLAIV